MSLLSPRSMRAMDSAQAAFESPSDDWPPGCIECDECGGTGVKRDPYFGHEVDCSDCDATGELWMEET